ncbi:hypothetical protein FACS1894190_14380 [Spirochaetia bacterium]|nr:hypothetical protein FACS1894190_14380 [Spirochaetia bacterium]
MYKNILAIDCAGEILSVALKHGDSIFNTEIDSGNTHSELLLDATENLLQLARLDRESLELVACMNGPGSFTGLRIGFAAAKALALALNIPITAVPTLDCLAFPHAEFSGLVMPVLDAKQKRFFVSFYKNGIRLTDYLDIPAGTISEEIKKLAAETLASAPETPATGYGALLTGGGAGLVFNQLKDLAPEINLYVEPSYRRGAAVLLLKYIGDSDKIEQVDCSAAPLYLRKSDAEINSCRRTGNFS